MNKETDTYKIFRQLEERQKRANPYKFYDKDELIDEILKSEDEIEKLNNIINELEKYLKEKQTLYGINQQGFSWGVAGDCLDKLKELKGE